jgi:hypothetical protein
VTRAELDRAMRAVLAELEICSHVPAAGWGPKGRSRSSDEHPGGGRPPGDTGHTPFAEQYGPPFSQVTATCPGCFTDGQRERVLRRAQDELRSLRYGNRLSVVGETASQRQGRIVKDAEGWSLRDAAVHFRTSEREISKARRAAKREPEFGRPVESPDRDRIVGLYEQGGRTIASLAIQFGVSRSTVERYVGKRKPNGRAA